MKFIRKKQPPQRRPKRCLNTQTEGLNASRDVSWLVRECVFLFWRVFKIRRAFLRISKRLCQRIQNMAFIVRLRFRARQQVAIPQFTAFTIKSSGANQSNLRLSPAVGPLKTRARFAREPDIPGFVPSFCNAAVLPDTDSETGLLQLHRDPSRNVPSKTASPVELASLRRTMVSFLREMPSLPRAPD